MDQHVAEGDKNPDVMEKTGGELQHRAETSNPLYGVPELHKDSPVGNGAPQWSPS